MFPQVVGHPVLPSRLVPDDSGSVCLLASQPLRFRRGREPGLEKVLGAAVPAENIPKS